MKISEFLSLSTGEPYFGAGISPDLFSKLTNDFGIPSGTVEFMGAKKFEYNLYSETFLLYKFPKDSCGLGEYLKFLGTLISRVPLKPGDDMGIQEIDVTQADGYYAMFYLMEENKDENQHTCS